MNWFAQRPPTHIKGITTNECPDHGLGGGGHGEEIAIGYRVTCKCGHQYFSLSAYLWRQEETTSETTVSPISAICSKCASQIVLFDSSLHGYEAVACNAESTVNGAREENSSKIFLTEEHAPVIVDVIAYYPDDLFDEEFDEFSNRRSDLFTWFRVIAVGEDSEVLRTLDFECA